MKDRKERMLRLALTFACVSLFAGACKAQQEQQPIGSIATHDALVTGGLQVQGDQAKLLTNVSIAAYNRTAPIDLARGGNVLVCSTSRFHLQRSGADASLVFALDRGAIEIHSDSQPRDVVLTPDLRMTFAASGHLDLRLRVTPNGDTCVENTGKSAPQIAVSDAFSDSSYRLHPGQHVMFEHGSLREVVDQELSPCGCPPETALPINVAHTDNAAGNEAASRNPFPAAVSQGLAPETRPVAAAPPSKEPHTQVATTMVFSEKTEAATAPVVTNAAPVVATAPAATTSLAPPASPPGAHDLAHAIGRFFHRLFHGKAHDAMPNPASTR